MMRTVALSVAVIFLSTTARGEFSYPMLMGVRPAAVQIGQASEVTVLSRYNLRGAYQVLVQGEGVTGEVVPPEVPPGTDPATLPAIDNIKVRFTVSPDALPGVRDFRLATPQGASTVGQLVLVRDPVIVENGDNDRPEGALAVTLPATLCGTIEKPEDVDYYKFTVAAGSVLTFHVRCARLEDRLHDFQSHADPILTLRNASGTVLELVDNYFFADPLLSYRFETAGDYFLEIRDVRYQGNGNWHYAIEANDRPFVTNAFPLGVANGAETRLSLVGFNLPADPFAVPTLPADAPDGPRWIIPPLAGLPANPARVIVSRLPAIVEVAGDNNVPAQGQPVAVPCGISGRIDEPSDIDCYSFDAKQGERFSFEVLARRYQSALDPTIRILNADGGALAENDDLTVGRFTYADSQVENWTAPADGRYSVEIRDLHLRGGPSFVYFLQATRADPYFYLETDTDKTQLAPGSAGALFVRCYRKNGFAGEVQLAVEGLPPGVTASCGHILADGTDGCIVLQAAGDAPRGCANLRITGSGTTSGPDGAMVPLSAAVQVLQEYYSPGGGRGNYPVDVHAVSVADPMEVLAVKVSTTQVVLKPGESQKVEILVERKNGFTGNVTLEAYFQHLGTVFGNSLPKGVSVDDKNSKTLLTAGDSAGFITLIAAADAPAVERQQTAMMANVSINFVMKMTYSSEPMFVTVQRPAATQ